jgi:15-cis-phytoene desaturase
MSARTGGYILLRLLQDLAQPGIQVDRVLNAPTNDSWRDPWLVHLRDLGVDYRLCHRVETIHSDGNQVTGISGHEVSWPERAAQEAFEDNADLYVAAVPVEVMQSEIDIPLKQSVPELGKLDRLGYRWMNGIVFYLREDGPLAHGHTIFIDSPWSLTAISQRQFWPSVDFASLGDGNVGGILSVDISEWETAGAYAARGKPANVCSREVIADEVWAQVKASLNHSKQVLSDQNLVGWFLDPDIVAPNPPHADTNLEPLLRRRPRRWPSSRQTRRCDRSRSNR